VEKILAEEEQIPPEWPISGTTGYEFIAALSHALIDDTQIDALHLAYEAVTEERNDVSAGLRAARELMVDRNFAGEFSRLLAIATGVAHLEQRNFGEAELHVALREMLIAFPVYRTYGRPAGMPLAGEALLQQVLEAVKFSAFPAALSFLQAILLGAVSEQSEPDAADFRTRFQQLTGPLMAKSVEDTLFFRNHAILAINEVGAEPLPHPLLCGTLPPADANPVASSTRRTFDDVNPRYQTWGRCPCPTLFTERSARTLGRERHALAGAESIQSAHPERRPGPRTGGRMDAVSGAGRCVAHDLTTR
jgi:maltooligosyl trehalose synthase (EC 5.4.99.15)